MMRSMVFATLFVCPVALAQVDLVISDLPDVFRKGTVNGIHGYAVGFTVCNVGTEHASWQSQTNQHPVEGWGMFRLADGRFEQIGVSWLKHGNFAASSPGCGTCDTRINGNRLGVGCRDTYDALFNSSSYGLGARSEVNPATGVFPFPPRGWTITGNNIYKMCQVAQADLTTPGAMYFVEGNIVHPQDAAAGLGANNASFRRVTVNPSTFVVTPVGATQSQSPAIRAWRDFGLGGQPDPDVVLNSVDVPGDGRLWVASKATLLGNGLWHYEYAIENLSSDRSVGAVSVAVAPGSPVVAPGFHDVDPHSDEVLEGSDWTFERGSCAVMWSTAAHAVNPNANALRWGTLYNFRFDSPLPPASGSIALELFRPGTPSSVLAGAVVPSGARSADFNGDGFRDFFDYDAYVECYETAVCPPGGDADFNGDGFADFFDYDAFVEAFESGC